MNDDIKITFDYLFNHLTPFLTDKVLLRNTEIPERIMKRTNLPQTEKSGFEIDYRKTIMTYEFENRIFFNTLNYAYALDAYKISESYLRNTLDLIQKNLKDHD